MSDPATTFSIEVMGFPRDSDPEAIAGSLAEFFGISLEEGRRLVRKAPVRVKRNAPAETAQQLVRQLRKLGADVLVRNEQTGEERTYRAGDAPISRPMPAPVERTPPEDTLESEDANAPPESPPRVAVVVAAPLDRVKVVDAEEPRSRPGSEPGEEPAAISQPMPLPPRMPSVSASGRLRTPMAAGLGEPRSPSPSQPGDMRAPSSSKPSDPRPAFSSSPGEARPSDPQAARAPVAISVPPPSQQIASVPPPSGQVASIPPPSRTSLQFCGACKAPIDKGEICSRCGWSNADKQRHCRQCKKKLVLVSNVSKSPVLVGAIAAGSLAMGAGALVLFGGFPGVAALAFGAGLGFLGDAFTLRFACKTCTIAVVSERLQKEEQARIDAARRRSLAIGIGSAVLAAALLLVPAGSAKALTSSSFGMSWSVEVPSSHSHVDSEVATLQVPAGTKRARVQWAERSFLGGKTYFLMNIQYTYPVGAAEPDKPGLQASMKQIVEVVFNGSLGGALEPAGESFQAEFSGTFHGKPVSGRLRGTQYEHDFVIVAVTSGAASDLRGSDVDGFLSSVTVQRDAPR